MFSKKLKWYPLFSSVDELEDAFTGKQAVVHRSMFGEVLLLKAKETYYAFKNKCPHQNKPMNDCFIEDGSVVCPFHRYHYSLEDGKGHGLFLEKYELKFSEGQVWLGKEKWSLF